MPITPFHFGPGLLFRSATRHVSFGAFALVNCLIDIEPIVSFLLTGNPQHRFLHTYVGATFAALLVGLYAKRPIEHGLRWWNKQLSLGQSRWFGCNETISIHAMWIGAMTGAWSHIWLDAFMHHDVEPWWPVLAGNSVQGQIGLTALHALCVAAGLTGILLIAWQRIKDNFPRAIVFSKGASWIAGIVLILFFGYYFYSLATGKERVSAICHQMKPGMPYEELVLLAKTHGLGPGLLRPDAKLVYLADIRSYGRHACRVELENGVVMRATYNYAD